MRFIFLAFIASLIAGPGFAEDGKKWRIGGGFQISQQSQVSGHVGTFQITRADMVERGTISVEFRPNSRIGVGADFVLPAALAIKGPRGTLAMKTGSIALMGRYYADGRRKVRPFAGFGFIYNRFTKEELYNSPSEAKPDVENSLSPSIAFGLEFPGKKRETFRAELSYHRSTSKVLVNGRPIGAIRLSPINFGVSYLARF